MVSDDADELIGFLGETMNDSTANGVAQVSLFGPNLIPNPNPNPRPEPNPNPNLKLNPNINTNSSLNPTDANPEPSS